MSEGFTFADRETGEETYCGVRVVGKGVVGLSASQRSGGEVEVFLSGPDALRLAELLSAAGADT